MIETAGSVLRHRAAGGVRIQSPCFSSFRRHKFFGKSGNPCCGEIRWAAGTGQWKPLRSAGMLGEYRNARNLSP